MTKRVLLLIILVANTLLVFGQEKKKQRKGEFYFSWGYNQEWYTRSTIRVMQPGLGNDYKLENLEAHDHKGWDEGLFKIALSIPQYNYRIGYIFNKNRGLGWEINFDHTKYIVSNQNAHVVGKVNNRQVDTTIAFNAANGYYYFLNNGANFLLFNLTKRWQVYQSKDENFKLDAFGKAGIGPLIPHVQNRLSIDAADSANTPHFQLGGWNVGAEAAVRATVFKHTYIEFANKLDFASYSGLRMYEGRARQMFGTYELILSIGYTFPMGHREIDN